MGIDPGRHWLEAGITGLARQREWDAVETADAPGKPGDEAGFVALADRRLLVEVGPPGFDPTPLADALARSIEPPYRAAARRRDELWVVGASSLETVDLAADPRGDTLELVQDAGGLSVRVDGMPSHVHVPELERLGEERGDRYVVLARRLVGRHFEVEVLPL